MNRAFRTDANNRDWHANDAAVLRAFEAAAATADLVSFDLFDTLVQRKIWQPDDLFALLATTLPEPAQSWFAAARGAAETLARQKAGAREITLAAIYDELRRNAPPEVDLAAIMAREIAMECDHVLSDERIARVFHAQVAAGRTVIIVSDMYLPCAAIEVMLARTGLAGPQLYLSSETGLTKASGAVWQAIRSDLGLGPSARIVHLGDNPQADGAVAGGCGIIPFLLTPPGERRPPNRFRPVGDPVADLPHALLRAALADGAGDPYWLSLAYLVVAPTAIGMAGMIDAQARADGRRVFFLARDGLVFQRAYEAAWRGDEALASSYIWSSRRCLNLASITKLTSADLDFLCSGVSDVTIADYLRRAALDPAAPTVEAVLQQHGVNAATLVTTTALRAALRAVFTDLAAPITARAAIERYDLFLHLDQIGLFADKSLVVDLGWHGSLQNSLIRLGTEQHKVVPDMAGIYLGTSAARVRGLRAEGFLFTDGAPGTAVAATVGQSYEVLELLFSAPESGISHVVCRDGVPCPVRLDQTEEAPRLAIAGLVHRAVVDVAQAMRPYLRDHHVKMLREMALTRLGELLTTPDFQDAAQFATVPHAEGFGVSSYRPIVPAAKATKRDNAAIARTSFWPAGFLAQLDPASRFAVRALNATHRRISIKA